MPLRRLILASIAPSSAIGYTLVMPYTCGASKSAQSLSDWYYHVISHWRSLVPCGTIGVLGNLAVLLGAELHCCPAVVPCDTVVQVAGTQKNQNNPCCCNLLLSSLMPLLSCLVMLIALYAPWPWTSCLMLPYLVHHAAMVLCCHAK